MQLALFCDGVLACPAVDLTLLRSLAATGVVDYEQLVLLAVASLTRNCAVEMFGGRLVFAAVNDSGAQGLPEWAERAFMRSPRLWPNDRLALTRRPTPETSVFDAELGYLQALGGAIYFFSGNMMFEQHPYAGRPMSLAACEGLFAEGWRVD